MTQYFGDFAEDATVYIPFNTFDSNDPSASVTITNLADADIKVHKDGSATQIVTDGATIAIDFDSITGNHLITVDTSAHADYATGSDYIVRIEGTTVDAATINAWVGSFSIENRYSAGALRPTTAGRTLDVTATGAAGIDWGNVENKTTANDLSGTDIQLVDTATTVTGGATAAALATVDTVVDGIQTDLSNGTDGLGAIKADTAATLVDTAQIGAAGAGLTDLGGMSTAMKAEVNVEAADVLFTDTDAEPAQGTPGATISIADKIGFLYKAWRNKSTSTATAYSLYNDDTTTVDHKSTLSDDATTATKTEIVTGP